MKELPPLDRLRQLIRYDAETGNFWWLVKKRGRRLDRPAGVKRSDGYRLVNIDGRVVYQHRLAWLFATGSIPNAEIDHIDGNPSNNAICNLRAADRHENAKNAGRHSNNTSGFKGVDYRRKDGRWRARIRIKGQRVNLGLFASPEAAFAAYTAAADALHGEFVNHG